MSFLKVGLTTLDARRICRTECRAGCCRGPQYLRLSAEEIALFERHAAARATVLHLHRDADGSGFLRFPDHPGERCPMLDESTNDCSMYPSRPFRCRAFPEGPRAGCAISSDEV